MSKKHRSKSTFNGFKQTSNTPVPDDLFDELLEMLTGAELKVLLYIIRRTKGFGKDTDAISLSQFQHGIKTKDGKQLDKGCGVKDRQTIVNALESLETKKCIGSEKSKTASGDNAISIYRVLCCTEVVGKTNQGDKDKDQEKPTRVVGNSNQGGRKNPEKVVGKTNPQETVIQQTDLQQTVIQEDITDDNFSNPNIVPSGTSPSLSSQDQIALLTAQLAEMQSQLATLLSSKQNPTGDTHVPNTPSPTTSTGPDTIPSSGVRDNPSSQSVDSGSNSPSDNTSEKVEQKSIQNNPSNLIANGTTEKEVEDKDKEAMAIGDNLDTGKQETLFEVPDSPPVMPPESMPWNVEKMVQITEAKRFFKGKQGKRFSEELQGNSKKTQRERQKKAAEKILSFGITEEQYVTAYNECNNAWWNAKGSVTVEIMAANTPRGVTRVIELLDQIESRGESNVISFQDRQTRKPTQSATEVTAKVSEEINNRNFEKMMAEYEALQGVR